MRFVGCEKKSEGRIVGDALAEEFVDLAKIWIVGPFFSLQAFEGKVFVWVVVGLAGKSGAVAAFQKEVRNAADVIVDVGVVGPRSGFYRMKCGVEGLARGRAHRSGLKCP